MNDKNKILYNTIYNNLRNETEKSLLITEYETKKLLNNQMVVDFENLTIGFKTDFEEDLMIYKNTAYRKSVVYRTILEVIKNLMKGNSNEKAL
jgi:hypothetical protein